MKKLAYAIQNKDGEFLTGGHDRYFTPHLGLAAIRPRMEEAETLLDLHLKMVERRDDLKIVHVVPVPDCIYAMGSDWEGLYVDGKLIDEGHSMRLDTILSNMGMQVTLVTLDQDWLEDAGRLPKDYSDVKLASETEEAEEEPTGDFAAPEDVSGPVDLEHRLDDLGGAGL